MPQPTRSQVHVDKILTQLSVAYMQSQDAFIASKVFPIIPVDKQSDKYFTYTKNDWFRDEAARRADGTESAGSGYGLSTDSYSCDVWAFHKDVGAQARANADTPLNLDAEASRFVARRLLLRQEIQWVADYFTTGVWAKDYTGVSGAPSTDQFKQWNDATSDPIEDIEQGKEQILSTTGMEANTLVIGYQVFRQLKKHPDIIDRIKYTTGVTGRTITADMLAAMFDVERVLVAKGVKATNNEGATGAYAFVHGKGALLSHVAPQPGLLTPSAGYIFAWRGVSSGLGETIGTSTFYDPKTKADRVEGEIAFDDKVVASDLACYFTSVVA